MAARGVGTPVDAAFLAGVDEVDAARAFELHRDDRAHLR
jgi:hypothetical protein